MPCDPVKHGVHIVDRNEHLRQMILVVGRNVNGEGRNEKRHSDVVLLVSVHDRFANRGIAKTERRSVDLDPRRFISRRAQPRRVGGRRS